jgi:hypothetical protein
MPDTETGNRGRNRQKIPRIGPKEAALVFARCEHLLDSSTVFVENLRQAGFARFLAPPHEQILELAVQPDSWGERTRARLISEVLSGLKGIPAEDARLEEMCRSRMLWFPVSFSNWDAEDNTLTSNFLTIPVIPPHTLRFAPGRPIRSIPSAASS